MSCSLLPQRCLFFELKLCSLIELTHPRNPVQIQFDSSLRTLGIVKREIISAAGQCSKLQNFVKSAVLFRFHYQSEHGKEVQKAEHF